MNFLKRSKALAVSAITAMAAAMAASPAHAAIDLTGVTVDTTDYLAIAALLIGALVTFWGVKKGISLFGGR